MGKTRKELLMLPRLQRALSLITCYKEDLGKRLNETRKLFGRGVYAVDIHTHSKYSDGRGTVKENIECSRRVALDFMFATDHRSIGQKRSVRNLPDASWGQEPGAGPHHMGLLCNQRLFKPRLRSLAEDYARARKAGAFAWIPHPAGWYPKTWYSDEKIETLWTLGNEFTLEVINGAHKLVRAYDQFDAKAVGIWDRLLCDGRKVSAVGGSDAHAPDDIGTTWTGVFASKCTAAAIIEGLNKGLCFASEAALLKFSCNGRPMGSTIKAGKRDALEFKFRVADSAGVNSIRIISQGKITRQFFHKGEPLIEGVLSRKMGAKPAYYRLEVSSSDDRRAFSTPVYVEPKT